VSQGALTLTRPNVSAFERLPAPFEKFSRPERYDWRGFALTAALTAALLSALWLAGAFG
jgi:hypothetical protein